VKCSAIHISTVNLSLQNLQQNVIALYVTRVPVCADIPSFSHRCMPSNYWKGVANGLRTEEAFFLSPVSVMFFGDYGHLLVLLKAESKEQENISLAFGRLSCKMLCTYRSFEVLFVIL
jgi:hypothetical protein